MNRLADHISRGVKTIGGASPVKAGRHFVVEAKLLSSTDQAVPLRVIHGRDRVAGVHIVPIFGFGSQPIETEAGK